MKALPPSSHWLIDMVHHNPGEEPFDTRFIDPRELKARGFNAQCFKHINTIATFPGVKAPPPSPKEAAWLEKFTRDRVREIRAAKAAGLAVLYHIDLVVLPQRIVETHRDAISNPSGKISFDREKTRQIHQQLFDEIFARFPEIDGIIPRIGETYLYDTPFHTGNGAVWYEGHEPRAEEVEGFVQLLRFLREEVCVKHQKWLIHRTWDTWPNRFHASRDFYLNVTNQIEPHEKLLFSIKHTQVDFHRYAAWNPCLGEGRHPQIVEVQCQREYEGKGAYPNYSTYGVIEGFPEKDPGQGLREFVNNPLFRGIYTWSRGGGWYGPRIHQSNEFWCDVNLSILARFVLNPGLEEEELFSQWAKESLGLIERDVNILHNIAVLSLEAVKQGKCCKVWDTRPGSENDNFPTNQWMRDDVLGGWELLQPVFDYLYSTDQSALAIEEKASAVKCWSEITELADRLKLPEHPELRRVIQASCAYGLRLFTFIANAWEALYLDYSRRNGGKVTPEEVSLALAAADDAWTQYEAIHQDYPAAASIYRGHGWHWPQDPAPAGIKEALDDLRNPS